MPLIKKSVGSIIPSRKSHKILLNSHSCTTFLYLEYTRKLIVGKPLRCKLGLHASPKVVWEYPFNCKLCGALVKESERLTDGNGGDD